MLFYKVRLVWNVRIIPYKMFFSLKVITLRPLFDLSLSKKSIRNWTMDQLIVELSN